ncbi:MAG: MarR family transcriptional regulator [Acidobacteriaceae bacterium]
MRLRSSSLKSPAIGASAEADPEGEAPYSDEAVHDQAHFRYALRKFLRFSENAARRSGVTPQQHQLMLGVAGFTGRGSATVSELAEFLQERPHSVVGLIERAVQHGLVRRAQDETDRRVVNVSLTAEGEKVLSGLMGLHREAASAFRFSGLSWPRLRRAPEGERGERRRAQPDLTAKPDELREYKGNVRIK